MTKPELMVMTQIWPGTLAGLQARFALLRCDEAPDRHAFLRAHGQTCRAALVKGHDRFGQAELDLLPALEIVSCTSAGFESIDHATLHRAGIALTNTSLALKDDVADAAVMLTLAARRQLVACHAYVRSGAWGQDGLYPLLSSLAGKRAGILGFGTIGQEIAARLAPMRLEIGYSARQPRASDLRYFSDAATLAEWCDILIVAVPGGAETNKLVNRDVLTKLGPTGTLINIARGSVIDEAALIDCLRSGELGSAGLDVFQNEPHPDPALTALPNVTLYPHHASGTIETRSAMAQLAVDNLIAHFENRPLLTPVSGPDLPKETSR